MNQSVANSVSEVNNTYPLIHAEELVKLLYDPTVKLFDVRGTWKTPPRALQGDYQQNHISGACFLDWTKHFIEQDIKPALASVSSLKTARASFKTLGINSEDLVVLYDDYDHMFAGRIWWAMRYWGFKNIKVLNGGWAYWQAQELAISTDIPAVTAGNFQPSEQPELRISLDEFMRIKESVCVLDGRGEQNFRGDPSDARSGHIPGAINTSFKLFLDQNTGLFKEPDALESIFNHSLTNWKNTQIVASCGSGYAGTVPMIALWALGVPSRLFDGSIAEWKLDESRPLDQQA